MIDQLLVPLDGSVRSTRALPLATALAPLLDAEVAVVDCLPPGVPTDAEEAWLAREVDVDGAAVHVALDVVSDLLATAAGTPDTVVCLASHGRAGVPAVVLGSTTLELIEHSETPVLVLGPHARVPESFERIQVAHDGSADADATLQVAARWAAALGATAWVTHVVDEETGGFEVDAAVHRAARVLRDAGLAPEWDVLHGHDRADALASWARVHGTDLLVVGSHRHNLVQRVLGTVPERLLHLAPCPVLVVGPAARG